MGGVISRNLFPNSPGATNVLSHPSPTLSHIQTDLDDSQCYMCDATPEDPRVLDCDHVFCLVCLDSFVTSGGEIACAVCSQVTNLPKGLNPSHLPKHIICQKPKTLDVGDHLSLVTSWTVEGGITSVRFDPETHVIFVGSSDDEAHIQMFSYTGRHLGNLRADRTLKSTRLAIDTKRKLLLAVAGNYVVCFNREGVQSNTLLCPQFQLISDVEYHTEADRYIVADLNAHKLHVIDPDTGLVERSIPAQESRFIQESRSNISLTSGCLPDLGPVVVTTDCWEGVLRVYSVGKRMKEVRKYGEGNGPWQLRWPNQTRFDPLGRLVVSDRVNHRLVGVHTEDDVREEKYWQILNTSGMGLGLPTQLDISPEGFMALSLWEEVDSPSTIMLLSLKHH